MGRMAWSACLASLEYKPEDCYSNVARQTTVHSMLVCHLSNYIMHVWCTVHTIWIMFNPHPKMLTEPETVGVGATLLLLPILILLSKELYSAEAR